MPSDAQVFIIDDDAAMRDSLEFLLGISGFAVRSFEAAAQFLSAAPHLGFGCLVTDIRMPQIDGIELLKRLNAAGVKLPAIVMTGHGDVPLAVEAMKLGAIDVLEKPFEDERLLRALRTALDRGADARDLPSAAEGLDARLASLSPRERQVMQALVSGRANTAIARECDISPRAVEVYRASVMAKMQAADLSDLARLAMRSGALGG
ncbi:response regulator FixJ [Labrys monachus]|uniref:Two-component system response regulator FixJ n=1 Tax=Labrys monachus TaxID=217067 RepID=A0ABU0F9P5_9HYPH|nr:response regulator FixJ [Labrys monachus]MDQ0391052.1 two-component system response regulator FixJ [Labrys monachus]